MPDDIVEEVRRTAERSAIEAAWVQWSALTSLAVPLDRPPHWSIVDPEALVLTSLAMSPLERRLEDVLAAWSRTAGFLHSKPRFKRLVVMFPDAVAERLGDFARYAARGGRADGALGPREGDAGGAVAQRQAHGALEARRRANPHASTPRRVPDSDALTTQIMNAYHDS